MEKKYKEKEFRIWGLASIIVILFWSIFVGMFYNSHKESEKNLLDAELERFQGEVNSTLVSYEEFSNYIFDEINEDEEVLSLLYKANTASDEEKKILRNKLYNKFSVKYPRMEKYKFKQVHFHLRNTESFLRIHAPDKYGDLLSESRESVRLVNEKNIKVSGFEEGKVLNGFRNVYPLNYKNKPIGSVEISMSSASVMEILSQLHENKDFYFIVEKSLVDKILFKDQLKNYRLSNIFNDYYIDIEVDHIISDYHTIGSESKQVFFENIKRKYNDKLENKESFAIIEEFEGEEYLVNFLGFKNFKEVPSAYLISISKSLGYRKFIRNMYKEIILVSLLAFFIIAFGLALAFYQNKLKNSAELDYLTKIYNRNKFQKIVDREIKIARRYKQSMSLMLIDIDFFKKINDTYGHDWGDEVLKKLTSEISENIREIDVFARWGGEEFVMFLPNTEKKGALILGEKLRKLIDDSQEKELKDVSISIGITEVDLESHDINEAIKLADEAMYEAKRRGRNQVAYRD